MDYKRVVVQWMEFVPPSFKQRDISVDLESDFIASISGPRRAGKTYLCFQLMDGLLGKGVPAGNILYLNFEDEKLIGAQAEDIERLMDAFYELSDVDQRHNLYLFMDEVQNVTDWDAWVRRIYDTKKNVKLIVTGSSSKLLSREVSTKLRGRVINHEVFPLSFKEYLSWKGVSYDLRTISDSGGRFELKKLYEQYLANGGYPAVVSGQAPGDTILQGYYESMIFKDIVERHGMKEVKKLRLLANLLFESAAKEITYTKLSNKLKSLGLSTSKNTIIEYVSYFEDAYLFFQNIKYDYSITKQLGSIKKIYCIDNGLLNAVSFKFAEDRGRLMENAAYLELKRRGSRVYYHRNGHECDFLIQEKNQVVCAIQVTETLTEDNEKRELSGLTEAMSTHGLKEGLILTADQEEERTIDGRKIKILPLWKWLLQDAT